MISAKNIAGNFHNYFVSPGTTLAKQITVPKMFDCFIKMEILLLCSFVELMNLTIETVRKQTNKQTIDAYSIDMKIIEKKLLFILLNPLKELLSPNNRKSSNLICMFKSGDKHYMDNYQSVSLLPQFSKMLKKRLWKCNHCQKIRDWVENNKISVVSYMDLQKSFDIIYYSKLLRKLDKRHSLVLENSKQ